METAKVGSKRDTAVGERSAIRLTPVCSTSFRASNRQIVPGLVATSSFALLVSVASVTDRQPSCDFDDAESQLVSGFGVSESQRVNVSSHHEISTLEAFVSVSHYSRAAEGLVAASPFRRRFAECRKLRLIEIGRAH